MEQSRYDLCVYQTPPPLILDDSTMYEHKGSKDVFCKSGASGLQKRQVTAKITLFADCIPRFKPLIIFKGKGLRISAEERKAGIVEKRLVR